MLFVLVSFVDLILIIINNVIIKSMVSLYLLTLWLLLKKNSDPGPNSVQSEGEFPHFKKHEKN